MHDPAGRTAPLDLAVDPAVDHILVTVAGEIDYSTADRLRHCLVRSTTDPGDRVLVLDLSAVSYFGSVGLTILLETAQEVAGRSSAVHPFRVVVDGSRPVIRPLQISGVQSVIRLYHDLDGALRDSRPPDLR